MNIGIIILAAGNSSRMGSPKQLLAYQDQTLLQHTISSAVSTPYAPIVLVLGAYAKEIIELHTDININVITNDNWEQGLSSSIAAGISKMLALEPETSSVIIAVADQPFISSEIFMMLANESSITGKGIVASSYVQTTGTPVLFSKRYFGELLSLEGHSGAKPLLQKYAADLATVPFELGRIDIDTQTDYQNLTNTP